MSFSIPTTPIINPTITFPNGPNAVSGGGADTTTDWLEWLNSNQTLQWEREQEAAQQAQAFAQTSAEKAMAFESNEASIARDWSDYMSSTAHQRAVADLKAAGLNPILAANDGASAGVASGASGKAATPSKAVAPSARDFAAQYKDVVGSTASMIKTLFGGDKGAGALLKLLG